MRFTIKYLGERDFSAATYDDAHRRILERHRIRQEICGFRLSLSSYEVIDNWDVCP